MVVSRIDKSKMRTMYSHNREEKNEKGRYEEKCFLRDYMSLKSMTTRMSEKEEVEDRCNWLFMSS